MKAGKGGDKRNEAKREQQKLLYSRLKVVHAGTIAGQKLLFLIHAGCCGAWALEGMSHVRVIVLKVLKFKIGNVHAK